MAMVGGREESLPHMLEIVGNSTTGSVRFECQDISALVDAGPALLLPTSLRPAYLLTCRIRVR